MRATVAAILGIWMGGASALGCGSTDPEAATEDDGTSAASSGDAPGVGEDRQGECGDAGLSDPGLYDAGSSAEALADSARRRTACSLTVQLTRRGKPLTIDYAIK